MTLDYHYNKQGDLIIKGKKASKSERKYLRIWGFIIVGLSVLFGFILGKLRFG